MTPIADDEVLLRRIPGGTTWVAPGPPPRITSRNFLLRADRGETGVSVTRQSITTAEQLLQVVGAMPDARVASATAGDIRALGLDVIPVPLPDDPGHSEIRSASANLSDVEIAKRLAALFKFVDPPGGP